MKMPFRTLTPTPLKYSVAQTLKLVKYPPCSTDLVAVDYRLLRPFRGALRGYHLSIDQELKTYMNLWLVIQQKKYFSEGIHKLVGGWMK
jgi:hypothetical protein